MTVFLDSFNSNAVPINTISSGTFNAPSGPFTISSSPFSTGNSIQTGTSSSSVGGFNTFVALGIGAQLLGTGIEIAGLLDAKKQVSAQARFNRIVATQNAENEISNIRLFSKRFQSTQKAQGSATGFSTESSLVLQNQTIRDTETKVIRRNQALINEIQAINAQERAQKRGLRSRIGGSFFNAFTSVASIGIL